jgi:hypothetical protein
MIWTNHIYEDITMRHKLSHEEFIVKSQVVHGNKYDYSECIYVSSRKKVKIICQIHGIYEQTPSNHLHGYGCFKCRKRRGGPSFEEFISRAKICHGGKYSYDEASFKNVSSSVTIICPDHGTFKQRGSDHLQGKGCRRCMGESNRELFTMTIEEFIMKAQTCFGDRYDYTSVVYKGNKKPIIIICNKHGVFEMTPNNHLRGHGCPRCAIAPISKISQKWLDLLGVPKEYRERRLSIERQVIVVDALDPTTNTVYEFWGDFWHGNPKVYVSDKINHRRKMTFGELYEKTVERRLMIIEAGYNLIEIWENDFKR